MRKAALLLAMLFAPCFAFHNFTMTPATARIGIDSVLLAGNYEHTGDTATITSVFIDRNGNHQLDAGVDIDFLQGQTMPLIDGAPGTGDGPSDPDPDGVLALKIPTGDQGPFGMPGVCVITIASHGIADTAWVEMIQIATNTYVRGRILDPAGDAVKSLGVSAEIRDSSGNYLNGCSGVTDSLGKYVIYMDSTYRGKRVIVGIGDKGGPGQTTLPLAWIPPAEVDTLLVDSLTVNFAFTAATHFVKGTVVDEDGAPVKKAPLYLEHQHGGNSIDFTADSLGRFLVGVQPDTYNIYLQTWNFTGYLTRDAASIPVTPTTDTARVTFVVHTADTVISGIVHDDSTILGNKNDMSVSIDGNLNDVRYRNQTDIRSAGRYKISASNDIASYILRFETYNFPTKFFVYPNGYYNIKAGVDTCHAWIRKGNGSISGRILDSASNSMNGYLMIADSAHNLYFGLTTNGDGKFNQVVPSGTYTIIFYGNSQGANFGGTAGPIVITSQDTAMDLIGQRQTVSAVNGLTSPLFFDFTVINTRSSMQFRFASPVAGMACITLFDLKGQLLGSVLNQKIGAGRYAVDWSRQRSVLRTGQVYIARLEIVGARKFSRAQSFVVIR
jgi:hypothetical protein